MSAADQNVLEQAIKAAHAALETWRERPIEERAAKVRDLAEGYRRRKADLIEVICRQTGKPRWEAGTEVDAMAAKAAISIAAQEERRAATSRTIGDTVAASRFVPIGVLGVLGPFNMPGHLPNGHLMPAVLAGNTVIFKPSELTPGVGALMAEIWDAAGLGGGVFNLIQGGAETGMALASHPLLDGVLFTGSAAAGAAIHRALAGKPEKMLALEMGGNNPLVVWQCADLDAAAYVIVQSAFITAGQRCSCARRLIVSDDAGGEALMARLMHMISRVSVGLYTDEPEPFMGPVISATAAKKLMHAHEELLARGAKSLVPMRADPRSPALLWPGLIDVSDIARQDVELFGPLLQVIRVRDFAAALEEANRTRYGLSAGLVSDREDLCELFRRRVRAGVMNINRPLTGARSDLAFGGLGQSGNHRAGAYYAVDYCSDPVAALETHPARLPDSLPPGFDRIPA